MDITKYGHSCLQVQDRDANILIDPGAFSPGFESLTGLTAILITHAHPDHLDLDRIGPLVAGNPQARLYAEAAAAEQLSGAGIQVTVATAGQQLDVGTAVTTHGQLHEVIHADLPRFGNVGYLIGDRLFHPGDSLEIPAVDVEILAVPVMAPWMAMKQAIDFERAVGPKVAIPIHDHLLAIKAVFYDRLANMGPAGMQWAVLDDGTTRTF